MQRSFLFNFIDQSVAAAAEEITLCGGYSEPLKTNDCCSVCLSFEFNKITNSKLNRDAHPTAWSGGNG